LRLDLDRHHERNERHHDQDKRPPREQAGHEPSLPLKVEEVKEVEEGEEVKK